MKKRFEDLFQKVSAKELRQNIYLSRMQNEILKTIAEGMPAPQKQRKVQQDVVPGPGEVGHGH